MIMYRMLHLSFIAGVMLCFTASCISLETQKASNFANNVWPSSDALSNKLDDLARVNRLNAGLKEGMVLFKPKIDSAIFSACSTVIDSGSYQEHLRKLESSVDLELRVKIVELKALQEIQEGVK
ncbi:MAG: hypothetical protein FWG50_07520 [Kiritimatiellaeota bacterium]|nr:hypothetical protein [Kiritimatiellota bacterium]